jgi:hypothetical protein
MIVRKIFFIFFFAASCTGSFQDKALEIDTEARGLTIYFNSHEENLNTSFGEMKISGQVYDKINAIEKVEISINDGKWTQAGLNGEEWQSWISLNAGKNRICARVVNNVAAIKESCKNFYRTLKQMPNLPDPDFSQFQSGECIPYQGRAYCIGGKGHSNKLSIYNLETGIWERTSLIQAEINLELTTETSVESRKFFASSLIGDRIYVLGGLTKDDIYPEFNLVYDISDDKWRAVEPTISFEALRVAGAAVPIGSKIYVMGGGNGIPGVSIDFFSSVQVFNPSGSLGNKWNSGPSLNIPRAGFVALSDGIKIYVIGGYNSNNKMLDSVEMLDTSQSNPQWQALPSLSAPRFLASGGIVQNRYLYILGGMNFQEHNRTIERFDFLSGTWEVTGFTDLVFVENASFFVNDRIYLLGGMNEEGEPVRTFWEYTPFVD